MPLLLMCCCEVRNPSCKNKAPNRFFWSWLSRVVFDGNKRACNFSSTSATKTLDLPPIASKQDNISIFILFYFIWASLWRQFHPFSLDFWSPPFNSVSTSSLQYWQTAGEANTFSSTETFLLILAGFATWCFLELRSSNRISCPSLWPSYWCREFSKAWALIADPISPLMIDGIYMDRQYVGLPFTLLLEQVRW